MAVRSTILSAVFALLSVLPLHAAQTASARGKLIVTVSDPSGAVIPEATVTVIGLDDGVKNIAVPPAKTLASGIATFEGLTPGRYSIKAEFPGFDLGLLRDIRVNRGDNKHVLVLPLKNMSESVTVGAENQAADRRAKPSASTSRATCSRRCRTIRQKCSGSSPTSPGLMRFFESTVSKGSSCLPSRRSSQSMSRAISSRQKRSSRDRHSLT